LEPSYIHLDTKVGETLVLGRSVDEIAGIEGVIFDVDGVLIEVTDSIHLVHGKAAEQYFGMLGWENCSELVSPADVDAFKLAGGFNSDWELAFAWTLLYLFKSKRYASRNGATLKEKTPTIEEFTAEIAHAGGSLPTAVEIIRGLANELEWEWIESRWDRATLQRIFQETYSGDLCPEIYGFEPEIVNAPGLIRKDRVILDKRLLPVGLKLGIATGRTAGETQVGLRLAGLAEDFPAENIVTEDDGHKKPDPEVLRIAIERIGCRRAMYVGDTPDDQRTVLRYREAHGTARMASCMVLTGLKHPGLKQVFMEQGADLIADNVNAAMEALKACIGGAVCPAEQRM